jgi:hypothetical protein
MPAQQIFLINFLRKVKGSYYIRPWVSVSSPVPCPLGSPVFLRKIKNPFKLVLRASDRTSKSLLLRSHMRIWTDGKKWLVAVVFCFILPGMLSLLLLAGAACAQAGRQVGFQNLLDKPANLEKSALLPDAVRVNDNLPPELYRALLRQPSASRWWQTNLPDPLPPTSVFATQTNLCKYLDKWPAPGLTASPDEPPPPIDLTDDDLM